MTKFTDNVSKPYRYCGDEYGSVKYKADAEVRFCMCVPDTYEIGMSNLGLRILYYLFNSLNSVSCERCFAPQTDYAEYLKKSGELLSSLETHTPLKDFDFVGYSMQYELCYSDYFYMSELAGIPFTSEERSEEYPFVVAGGPCAVNLEPMYKFFDFIFVGEGESPWPKIIEDYRKQKGKVTKREFLSYVNDNYDCIYVPSLTEIVYDGVNVVSVKGKKVSRNIEHDFGSAFVPVNQIVPFGEIVHDRAVIELSRGCANGCRFCQAGVIYRPVRERTPKNAFEISKQLLENTGYDELSLNSLSVGDYSHMDELLDLLLPYAEKNRIKINLPSMRMDSFRGRMLSGGRKGSLTFAPEAGTQRLRDVINKNITEDNIFSALQSAFSEGCSAVKLYFMIGLPTETQEDVEGIYELVRKVKRLYAKTRKTSGALRVSVSAATFIPKPFTPFQWEAFASQEEVKLKQKYLSDMLRSERADFSYGDYESSLLEALLARGGRYLANVMADAYANGAVFDAWNERFVWEHYKDALSKHSVDVPAAVGEKPNSALLPWDYIDVGVTKSHLLKEREKAYRAERTVSCTEKCGGCGLTAQGLCTKTHGNASYNEGGK